MLRVAYICYLLLGVKHTLRVIHYMCNGINVGSKDTLYRVNKKIVLAGGYLGSYLLKLYESSIPILPNTLAESDLKWLRYDPNRNIIASHSNSGRLADCQLVS